MVLSIRAESVSDGNRKLTWPLFKPSNKDPVLGIKEMTPEQTLIEFISTSASLHGVTRQSIRQLEWDILKVFPYNIMPANAAAWYMAKRKFYANQPQDNQLLPFTLKKYPEKFRVQGLQVEFLEKYNQQVARSKLNYMVHYGLNAYFSHKVDEYGVYFFDPNYYEKTEPFHSSLELCAKGRRVNMLGHYFGWNEGFIFKQHSASLASITRNKKIKVMTNAVGVVISVAKNGQYGFLKFGSGEKAIFNTKALFKDGYPYTGDPQRLPAIYFDAYQIPDGIKAGDGLCNWFATAVWIGKRPAAKFYCTLADFRLTPAMLNQADQGNKQNTEGRRLRQPSSSMMIGQVVEIRRNGAVVSVRDDSKERVFIPGWSKQNHSRQGQWLTTLTGDSIGMRDLIAYYLDTNINMPGFTAVGKNIMILKAYEEVENPKRRRSYGSISLSSGARYDTETGLSTDNTDYDSASSYGEESEGEEVTDGELEWLEKDVDELISAERAPDMVTFLVKTREELAQVRAAIAKKSPKSTRERKDSGLGSKPTTPVHMKTLQRISPEKNAFLRTKAAFATISEEYRSSDDEDYETGDEISSFGGAARTKDKKRTKNISNSDSIDIEKASRKTDIEPRVQPTWVRAISMPEEYDDATGMFSPVDKFYRETRDNDYVAPYGLEYTEKEVVDGCVKYHFEELSDVEENEEGEEVEEENLDDELKALLEESSSDLPQDLLDGKHRISAEIVKEVENENKDEKSLESDSKEEKKNSESEESIVEQTRVFRERKIWYEHFYLKFIENLQVDEPEIEDKSEYYPAAVITDPDLDFDEVSSDWEIDPEEVKGLQEDLKQDVSSFGNYIPIWVHVESVQSRKEVAKHLYEENQKLLAEKAAEEAKKAAEEAAASNDAAALTTKDEDKVDPEPLTLENIEEAAKQVIDTKQSADDSVDAKPQRKLSAKGSPKKKSPRKEDGNKSAEVKDVTKLSSPPKPSCGTN